MGIKITDLYGDLVKCQIASFQKMDDDKLILYLKQGPDVFKLGLIGESVIKDTLDKHGEKSKSGTFLKVPTIKLDKNKDITWINSTY